MNGLPQEAWNSLFQTDIHDLSDAPTPRQVCKGILGSLELILSVPSCPTGIMPIGTELQCMSVIEAKCKIPGR